MDGQWYYVHNGASAGPVGAEVLLRLPPILWCVLLLVVGWYIVFGILKQSLAEVAAAKQAAEAAQPAAVFSIAGSIAG